MTSLYFTDEDASTNLLDADFSHTDHTVWLTFIAAFAPGFDHIKWMGMLFG